jgi:hypothetical protein
MKINNGYKLAMLLVFATVLGSYLLPLSSAQEWTLYGNVIDGHSCKALVGANVLTKFNNNESTITNANGNYTLLLGYGSWNITISKTGYTPITFNTPYETVGAYKFNTFLLATGASAVNCSATVNTISSTVPTTTATAQSTASTLPTTLIQAAQSGQSEISGIAIAGIGLVIIIVIGVVAYFAMKGNKQEKPMEKKEEPKKPAA